MSMSTQQLRDKLADRIYHKEACYLKEQVTVEFKFHDEGLFYYIEVANPSNPQGMDTHLINILVDFQNEMHDSQRCTTLGMTFQIESGRIVAWLTQ